MNSYSNSPVNRPSFSALAPWELDLNNELFLPASYELSCLSPVLSVCSSSYLYNSALTECTGLEGFDNDSPYDLYTKKFASNYKLTDNETLLNKAFQQKQAQVKVGSDTENNVSYNNNYTNDYSLNNSTILDCLNESNEELSMNTNNNNMMLYNELDSFNHHDLDNENSWLSSGNDECQSLPELESPGIQFSDDTYQNYSQLNSHYMNHNISNNTLNHSPIHNFQSTAVETCSISNNESSTKPVSSVIDRVDNESYPAARALGKRKLLAPSKSIDYLRSDDYLYSSRGAQNANSTNFKQKRKRVKLQHSNAAAAAAAAAAAHEELKPVAETIGDNCSCAVVVPVLSTLGSNHATEVNIITYKHKNIHNSDDYDGYPVIRLPVNNGTLYARCFDLAQCYGVTKSNRGREFYCIEKLNDTNHNKTSIININESSSSDNNYIDWFSCVSSSRHSQGQKGANITTAGIELWLKLNKKLTKRSDAVVANFIHWTKETLLPHMRNIQKQLNQHKQS
jgi:hypothetical protein